MNREEIAEREVRRMASYDLMDAGRFQQQAHGPLPCPIEQPETIRSHMGRVQVRVAGEWVYVVDFLRTLDDLTDDGVIDRTKSVGDELRRINRSQGSDS